MTRADGKWRYDTHDLHCIALALEMEEALVLGMLVLALTDNE